MFSTDQSLKGLRLPNTLILPPNHTAAVIGHLLRTHYAEEVTFSDYPGRLRDLIGALEAASPWRDTSACQEN